MLYAIRYRDVSIVLGQLLLFTRSKLHTGFPLVQKLITMNGIWAIILHYFTKISTFGANYITIFEVRPVLCATKIVFKRI